MKVTVRIEYDERGWRGNNKYFASCERCGTERPTTVRADRVRLYNLCHDCMFTMRLTPRLLLKWRHKEGIEWVLPNGEPSVGSARARQEV